MSPIDAALKQLEEAIEEEIEEKMSAAIWIDDVCPQVIYNGDIDALFIFSGQDKIDEDGKAESIGATFSLREELLEALDMVLGSDTATAYVEHIESIAREMRLVLAK